MKRCFKCGESKPLDEFYVHQGMADGHLNKCKECTKVDSSMRNPDIVREYEKERSARPERRAYALEAQRRRRRENPQKYSARAKVLWAIKSGRLRRGPCEFCGNTVTEAHHDDYSKPLEVRWMCMICHKRYHAATKV